MPRRRGDSHRLSSHRVNRGSKTQVVAANETRSSKKDGNPIAESQAHQASPAGESTLGEHTVVIEGRCGEGEQDDLDFKLESVPLPGKRDPGHSSGAPWCRWFVRAVGFSPPKGRPGAAQLAGVRPGDELVRIATATDKVVNPSVWGRERMRRVLDELGRRRVRVLGSPGGLSLMASRGGRGAEGSSPDPEGRWRMEFKRCPGAARAVVEAAAMEGRVGQGGQADGAPGVLRRRSQENPDGATMRFRIFREISWEVDGGRSFTVRVDEAGGRTGYLPCAGGSGGTRTDLGGAASKASRAEWSSSARPGETVGGEGDLEELGEGSGKDGVDLDARDATTEKSCPLRLLNIPESILSIARRRAGLPPSATASSTSRGVDRGGCPGATQRGTGPSGVVDSSTFDGEEFVTIHFCGGYAIGSGGAAAGERHLFDGLTGDDVKLVKNRIYAAARMEYARLYGWRASLSSEGGSTTPSGAGPRADSKRPDEEDSDADMDPDRTSSDEDRPCWVPSGKRRKIALSDEDSSKVGRWGERMVPDPEHRPGSGIEGDSDMDIDTEDETPINDGRSDPIQGRKRRRAVSSGGDSPEAGQPGKRWRMEPRPRPGSGVLSATLNGLVRQPAFLAWVEALRSWSAVQPGRGWADWSSAPGDLLSSGKAPVEALRFFVAWKSVEVEGKETPSRYPEIFRDFCAEAANAPGVEQVVVPAVTTSAVEREELYQAITTTASRLYPRWDAMERRGGARGGGLRTRRGPAQVDKTGRLSSSSPPPPPPPPPPPGAFSSAVNRTLRVTMASQSDEPSPMTEKEAVAYLKEVGRSGGVRKCDICGLAMATWCRCGAGRLAKRRALWHSMARSVLSRPRRLCLGAPESDMIETRKYVGDARPSRISFMRPKMRLDQSMSLLHRGLVRYFPPKRTAVLSGTLRGTEAGPGASSSSSSARSRKEGRSNQSPRARDASQQDGRSPLPRLEAWPGFPTPEKAFAPASPVESGTGLMPPSRRFLRYIHQVASIKANAIPELQGTMDESALLAVGVLVEEMLEELICPLVDGRTKGYKNLTSASLARELAFYRRKSSWSGNRGAHASLGDTESDAHPYRGTGPSGIQGDGSGIPSPGAAITKALACVFGDDDPLRVLDPGDSASRP